MFTVKTSNINTDRNFVNHAQCMHFNKQPSCKNSRPHQLKMQWVFNFIHGLADTQRSVWLSGNHKALQLSGYPVICNCTITQSIFDVSLNYNTHSLDQSQDHNCHLTNILQSLQTYIYIDTCVQMNTLQAITTCIISNP